MYGWLVERMVRRTYERMNRRDLAPVLARFAPDAHFRFAGRHALATDCRSKTEIAEWFRMLFARIPTLHFDVEEVVVRGTPALTRFCTRYTATAVAPNGARLLYDGVQYARIVWGKVIDDLVYPDTQAVAEYLLESSQTALTASLGAGPTDP